MIFNFTVFFYFIFSPENEDDTTQTMADHESSTILNECKKDAGRNRRPSLAQKMTSNLRRFSGAADVKIDMNDPTSTTNSKYCNKKIKVQKPIVHSRVQFSKVSFSICLTASQHSWNDGRGKCHSTASRNSTFEYRREKILVECWAWWRRRNTKVRRTKRISVRFDYTIFNASQAFAAPCHCFAFLLDFHSIIARQVRRNWRKSFVIRDLFVSLSRKYDWNEKATEKQRIRQMTKQNLRHFLSWEK